MSFLRRKKTFNMSFITFNMSFLGWFLFVY